MHGKSFIKTLVTSQKRKSIRLPGKWWVPQKSMRALGRILHQNRIHAPFILCASFSLNLLFKFNIVLIGIFLNNSTTIYLLFCLLINIGYITDLEVYPGHLSFFIRTSKILMRLGVLYLKVFTFKMLLLCSYFFMKNICWKTAKITVDVNNCL